MPDPDAQRIAKVLARAGLASRRDAEVLIAEGRVTVNGRRIDSPALTVTAADRITVDGQPLPAPEPPRLWRYHKPAGLVTTARDEEGRATVFDHLPPGLPRLMTVGRLDIASEGLLLLTNDGELKRRLELPATGWLRRYRVRVHGSPQEQTLEPLRDGITLDGEAFQPMEVRIDRQQGANAWLSVGLREGRNREVRRAMEAVGLTVNRLIRIGYGPFQLGDLAPGAVEEVRPKVLADQLGLETGAMGAGAMGAGAVPAGAGGGPSRGKAPAKGQRPAGRAQPEGGGDKRPPRGAPRPAPLDGPRSAGGDRRGPGRKGQDGDAPRPQRGRAVASRDGDAPRAPRSGPRPDRTGKPGDHRAGKPRRSGTDHPGAGARPGSPHRDSTGAEDRPGRGASGRGAASGDAPRRAGPPAARGGSARPAHSAGMKSHRGAGTAGGGPRTPRAAGSRSHAAGRPDRSGDSPPRPTPVAGPAARHAGASSGASRGGAASGGKPAGTTRPDKPPRRTGPAPAPRGAAGGRTAAGDARPKAADARRPASGAEAPAAGAQRPAAERPAFPRSTSYFRPERPAPARRSPAPEAGPPVASDPSQRLGGRPRRPARGRDAGKDGDGKGPKGGRGAGGPGKGPRTGKG